MPNAAYAELGSMIVRLVGDSTSFQKTMIQAQEESKRTALEVATAAKRIEGMQNSLHKFASGSVGILAGFGLVSSLQGAFKAADDLEDANRRLNASIEASGRVADTVREDYKAFANQIVEVTTVSKGEVMSLIEQAERMQITGDAAKRMAQNAVAFAAIQNVGTEEGMRAARALEMGNMQQLKFSLGLRGISDESKIAAIAQQRLAAGWKVALDRAEDVSGLIEKLQRTFKGLSIDIGAVVADAITPAVKWLTKMGETFRGLNPESKRLVVMIVGIGIAIAGLGPLVSSLMFTLAPLGAAFTFVTAAIGFLLTPIGLLGAVVIALGVYLIDTGTVVNWFGEQWLTLKTYIKPALDGMANALKAGNLTLAVEILWAQVKLSFVQGIQPVKEAWIGFTAFIAAGWIRLQAMLVNKWEETSTNLQNIAVWLKVQVGAMEWEEGKAEIERLGAALNKEVAANIAEAEAQVAIVKQDADRDVKAAQAAIDRLKGRRDELIKEAQEAADKMPPAKAPLKLEPIMPKIPTQTAKVKLKFDAAAFNSAEARFRVAEFIERQEHPDEFKKGRGKGGAAIAGEGKKFEAVNADAPEAAQRQDKQNELLGQIRDGVRDMVKKPAAEINPAQLQN